VDVQHRASPDLIPSAYTFCSPRCARHRRGTIARDGLTGLMASRSRTRYGAGETSCQRRPDGRASRRGHNRMIDSEPSVHSSARAPALGIRGAATPLSNPRANPATVRGRRRASLRRCLSRNGGDRISCTNADGLYIRGRSKVAAGRVIASATLGGIIATQPYRCMCASFSEDKTEHPSCVLACSGPAELPNVPVAFV
jgi:hypothetical protein